MDSNAWHAGAHLNSPFDVGLCPCRVKIVDKRAKGGRLYLKKGTIVDVKTPTGEPLPPTDPLVHPEACSSHTRFGDATNTFWLRAGSRRDAVRRSARRVPPAVLRCRGGGRTQAPAPLDAPTLTLPPLAPCKTRIAAVCDVFLDDLKQSVLVRGAVSVQGPPSLCTSAGEARSGSYRDVDVFSSAAHWGADAALWRCARAVPPAGR